MRRLTAILTILILGVSGCTKFDKPERQLGLSFHACDCNAIYVATMIIVDIDQDPLTVYRDPQSYYSQDFWIRILTRDYDAKYAGEDKDPTLSMQLGEYIERLASRDTTLISVFHYYPPNGEFHYRTEEMTGLTITADKELFGRPAGSILNDYFELFSTIGSYKVPIQFFFTADKELITKSVEKMSIEEFLTYRPMAPAIMYLKFNETPPEVPIDVRLTVTMTVRGKEPLTKTTGIITLL